MHKVDIVFDCYDVDLLPRISSLIRMIDGVHPPPQCGRGRPRMLCLSPPSVARFYQDPRRRLSKGKSTITCALRPPETESKPGTTCWTQASPFLVPFATASTMRNRRLSGKVESSHQDRQGALWCVLARSRHRVGAKPTQVAVSHGPGIEPCGGNRQRARRCVGTKGDEVQW